MKIGVVLVTYNRKNELEKALKCYEEQTYLPQYICVVNNASTDGTDKILEKWKKKNSKYKKIVLNLNSNTGGSGGFYTGLTESLKLDADWVWVSDDDAFPKKNAFEVAANFYEKYKEVYDFSAICGKNLNRGKIDYMHRRRIKVGPLLVKQFTVKKKEYEQEFFFLDLFTYVGTFINVEKMRQVGVTEKDYFIYYDDSEHSYRLSKIGKIVCVPKIEIIHDGPISSNKDGVNWKYYYLIRNTLDFIRRHFSKKHYKFYCFYIKIKNYAITTLLYSHKLEGYRLINKAIKDAKKSILGLDSYYKPGWKVSK